jgi:hypothetical protein
MLLSITLTEFVLTFTNKEMELGNENYADHWDMMLYSLNMFYVDLGTSSKNEEPGWKYKIL